MSRTANFRYKEFYIKKKSGGTRKICQPSSSLKSMQRTVSGIFLNSLPVSTSSQAYERGNSNVRNARMHQDSKYWLCMDFEAFFESFLLQDVFNFINHSGVEILSSRIFANLFCYKGSLTIGSPSSPALTNRMMYHFDEQFSSKLGINCIYTRYADDICISSTEHIDLDKVKKLLAETLVDENISFLKLNNSKTRFLNRGCRVNVTGVNITPQGNLSIGRYNKRRIRALLNEYKWKRLRPDRIQELAGLLSYCNQIDPKFVNRVSEKYGIKPVVSDNKSILKRI